MAVKIKQRLEQFNSTDLLAEVLRRLREGGPIPSSKALLKTAHRIVRRIEGKPENPLTASVATPFKIIVNGQSHEWDYPTIDYFAVLWLAEADRTRQPDVTWRNASGNRSGVLQSSKGARKCGQIEVQQGMVFHCYPTDSA